ncbi:unnamed protein product [Boreogadus saida]
MQSLDIGEDKCDSQDEGQANLTPTSDIQTDILSRRIRSETGLPRKIVMRLEDPRRFGLLAPAAMLP